MRVERVKSYRRIERGLHLLRNLSVIIWTVQIVIVDLIRIINTRIWIINRKMFSYCLGMMKQTNGTTSNF